MDKLGFVGWLSVGGVLVALFLMLSMSLQGIFTDEAGLKSRAFNSPETAALFAGKVILGGKGIEDPEGRTGAMVRVDKVTTKTSYRLANSTDNTTYTHVPVKDTQIERLSHKSADFIVEDDKGERVSVKGRGFTWYDMGKARSISGDRVVYLLEEGDPVVLCGTLLKSKRGENAFATDVLVQATMEETLENARSSRLKHRLTFAAAFLLLLVCLGLIGRDMWGGRKRA